MEDAAAANLEDLTPAQLIELKFANLSLVGNEDDGDDDDDEPGAVNTSAKYDAAFVKASEDSQKDTHDDGHGNSFRDEAPGRKAGVKELSFVPAKPMTATLEDTIEKWSKKIEKSIDPEQMKQALAAADDDKKLVSVGNPSAMEEAWNEIVKERQNRGAKFMAEARELSASKLDFFASLQADYDTIDADEGEGGSDDNVSDYDDDDDRDPLDEMIEEMEANDRRVAAAATAANARVGAPNVDWSVRKTWNKWRGKGKKKPWTTTTTTEDSDMPSIDAFSPKKFLMKTLGLVPAFKPLTSHKVADAAKPPLPNAEAIMSSSSLLSDIVGSNPEKVEAQLVRVKLPNGVNIVEQVQPGYAIKNSSTVTRVFPVTAGPNKDAFVLDLGNKKKGSQLTVTFKDQISGLERKLDAKIDTSHWKDLQDARAWIASDGKYTVVFRFDGNDALQHVIIVRDLISYKSLYDNKELSEIEQEMAAHLTSGRSLAVESVKRPVDGTDAWIGSIALAALVAQDAANTPSSAKELKTVPATEAETNLFHKYAATLEAMKNELGDEIDEISLAHDRGDLLRQAIAEKSPSPEHIRNTWMVMQVLATKGNVQDAEARLKQMDAAHPMQKVSTQQIVRTFLS